MEKTALEYRLALWLTRGLSGSIQHTIFDKYPNLAEFFKLSSENLKTIGFKEEIIQQIKNPPWQKVEETIKWSECPNHHLLLHSSSNYPKLLQEITDAPMVLMAKGNLDLIHQPQLAIVGSRNPSQTGLEIAYNFAKYLTQQGLVITSGMAIGIDASAHRGSEGQTIAVLGTGVNVCYPKKNLYLMQTIENSGLIISEFPLSTPPNALHFPMRNRIISGLSKGTFVVEAALKSGSLITARFALEQGRDVFTMPGSIHNPMARGCHHLLKQGAILVESIEDIWEHFNYGKKKKRKKTTKSHYPLDFKSNSPHLTNIDEKLSNSQSRLLDAIGFDRISADLLMQRTNLSAEQLSIELTELEILGLIEAVPGGFQKRLSGSKI